MGTFHQNEVKQVHLISGRENHVYLSGRRDGGLTYQIAFFGEGPDDEARGVSEIGTGPFLGISQMIGWQEEELWGTFRGCLSAGGLSLSSFTHQLSNRIWLSAACRSHCRCSIVLSHVNNSRSCQLRTLSIIEFLDLAIQ